MIRIDNFLEKGNFKSTMLLQVHDELVFNIVVNEYSQLVVEIPKIMESILKDAPNLKAANTFVEFLLNKNNGMKIMESNGQPSLVPSKTEYYDKIPDNLKKYVIK